MSSGFCGGSDRKRTRAEGRRSRPRSTRFALLALLAGCGSRTELATTVAVDAACAPVPCPSGRHFDPSICGCAQDRCPNDQGETILAQITTEFAQGTAIVVVDGEVYWTTRAGKNDTEGVVSKVSRCGGPVTTLAQNQIGPVALAVGNETVFFGTIGDDNTGVGKGALFRVPAAGGAPSPIAKGWIFQGGVTTDASFVYWTGLGSDSFGLHRAPLAGGAPEGLGPDQVFYYVAVDGSRIYLSQPATIPANARLVSMPLGGGDVSVLVPHDLALSGVMAIDDSFVYFADATGGQVALSRIPKAGGAPKKLVAREVNAIALDDHDLYWVQGDATSGASFELDRVPKAGGMATQLSSVGGNAIALDESYVFWLNGGFVRRRPK